ncbi:TPA: pentapeptide repeat-containing protein [Listeria monocytogenes]|nr:pentapeptide repeat-containing protein [Listeria monocytogenes]HDT8674652.1 pentapeptide repeat-containing protein [Listeria monocytogenes]HDT9158415.1 pentapeptide repeat-containing protein [Listeria monocytogenes]HDT9968334.1 pentapeptide repeat-containing protein [Listeria monocytogenes]HDU0232293.1 pentapeptide repeat-containing protein [Listeria monocytogenes]
MNQAELDVVIEKHEKWLRDGYGERADLRGANLRHADLRRADLSGANLRHANLTNANLTNADLSNADLSNADLSNANLTNAVLTWVNWQDVRGLTVVAVQVDTTRKNNQIAYIKELHIWTTGCFQGKLYKLKSSIEKTHKDNEKLRKRYYRVIDFILKEVAE